MLHDICKSLAREQAGMTAEDLVALLSKEDQVPQAALQIIQSNLADVLWFMGMELDADNGGDSKPDARKQYIALVTALVKKKLLGEELLISRLENDVLQEVGLIKDAAEFHKKQVRMNTKALYTQQKYNLFREETEGYSKLIAELSELPTTHEHTSTRGCKSAAEVIQNLQSLIGYFDLDPNRVLDLVLEALEAVPARVNNKALVSLFNPSFIPHMVGFKFSLYAAPGAPVPPDSLYTMCGLLLSQGSISLSQVLPHLSPSTRAMQDMDAKRVSERLAAAKRLGVTLLGGGGGSGGSLGLSGEGGGGGPRNKLAMMGSLDDGPAPVSRMDSDKSRMLDSDRSSRMLTGDSDKAAGGAAAESAGAGGSSGGAVTEEEDINSLAVEKLQPLGLLRALLRLRDWRAARELMLELDGVDVAAYPAVAEALCDLLEWVTAPAYAPISPLATIAAGAVSTTAATSAASADAPPQEDAMEVESAPAASETATAEAADPAATSTSGALKPATTPEAAIFAAVPILQRLGPHLHLRPTLLARMCRLCYAALPLATAENRIGEAVDQCIDASILPGLTVGTPNPGLGHELWRLIEKRPYTSRYRSYGILHARLKDEANAHPELAMARAKTADETKRMMRRLSKENTRQYGRHLGKLTHVVPSIVFDTMLEQIQAYDNLIVPVVEMMRYLTPMSFDVLTFIILSHLASPQKTQMKTDGLNVSMWMQSLSSFCGNLYKKYPSIELVGLLQYIANTLKSGTSLQLLLLRDLVTKMAGIEPLEDLSVDQLEAHAGGETLKTSVTDVLGIAKNTKRSSTRLREALVKHGLVVPLFLLIAQQRAACVYATDTPHLKVLSELYDKCHETLEQYAAFLFSSLPPAEYAELVPTVTALCHEFHLEPEVAFFICRPAIAFAESQEEKSKGKADGGDADKADEKAASSKHAEALAAGDMPGGLLSPTLYSTFWSHSLYDIFVPKARYEAEIRRQRKQAEDIDRFVPPIGGEPGDPKANATKRKKDKERCIAAIDKLKVEMMAQNVRNRHVMARLSKSKAEWFANTELSTEAQADTMNHFLQHCIFPRCVFSPADAVYCARFVQQTHAQGTPFFSTLQYYDKLLRDISLHIFCCTERQAANLGRFLKESLQLLVHWKSSEQIYLEECSKLPGFSVSFAKQDGKKATYEDFVKVRAHGCFARRGHAQDSVCAFAR